MTLRLGTRASALALTQSTTVGEALAAHTGRTLEIVRVTTHGDVTRASLASLGGTGVFVSALRESLLAGECDVAVHSLKDIPTAPAAGLTMAIPARAAVEDALVARDGLTLADLPEGSTVGTGSPRRASQLRHARPDLRIVDIRGNVPTRLARVAGLDPEGPGDLDAIILATAGLTRLGLEGHITERLSPDVMLSAPGQGALAVECREGDDAMTAALAWLADDAATLEVTAERALLAELEAGCAAPIGALAHATGTELRLDAVVLSHDGVRAERRSAVGTDLTPAGADALGRQLARELRDAAPDLMADAL